MKVNISGPLAVEEWIGPWFTFYPKDSLRWNLPVPIVMEGQKVGEITSIQRDDLLKPEQWIVGEGWIDVPELPESHNWKMYVKNSLFEMGEFFESGEIDDIEIGIPALEEKYDRLRFYIQ